MRITGKILIPILSIQIAIVIALGISSGKGKMPNVVRSNEKSIKPAEVRYTEKTDMSDGLVMYEMEENKILESTEDHSDRSAEITALLERYGICRLGPGKFYVSGVQMPENSTLTGCGAATKICLSETGSSPAFVVKMNTRCCVRDIMFVGSETDIELSPDVSDRHGIGWIGDYSISRDKKKQPAYGTINNCIFKGFSGGAITCDNTGPAVEHGLNISDVQIYNCSAGINIAYLSEYHRVTNAVVYDCYYACVNNGGNNMFLNCGFSNNKVGFITKMVDGSERIQSNNTHGSAIGCTLNHMDRDDITLGKGEAIHIENGANGFVFDGCQIFYGSIYIKNSAAIALRNCNIGNMRDSAGNALGIYITVEETEGYYNRDKLFISDCIFSRAPIINSLQTNGELKIVWDNCYTKLGEKLPEEHLKLTDIDLSDIKLYSEFEDGGIFTDTDPIDISFLNMDHLNMDPSLGIRYRHIIIPCNPGDAFYIEALGMGKSGEPHLQYVFTDSGYHVTGHSEAHELSESLIPNNPEEYVIAPENTAFLIVNHRIILNNEWYSPKVYKLSENELTNYLARNVFAKLPYISDSEWKENVIATYENKVAILDGSIIKLSKDCGKTWNNGVDISPILTGTDPVICNTHIYSNGCLAFFTKKHAYYIDGDWSTYNEATCYDIDGKVIDTGKHANSVLFKCYNDYAERKFIDIGGTVRDMFVFGNNKYGYDEQAIIWYSIDMGHSYKIAFDFGVFGDDKTPRTESSVIINDRELQIRHIHGVFYYEPEDRFLCMTGDYTTRDPESDMASSCVLELAYDESNDQWSVKLLGTGRDYKWTSIAVWDEKIYYSNDNTPGKILCCDYRDIGDLLKHTVILDGMHNDPRHIIFGHFGDMIVTQCDNRNISKVDYPDGLTAPLDKKKEARGFYYSPDRKNFYELFLPLKFLRGPEEVAYIKPLTSDGHCVIGTYLRLGGGNDRDKGILPSVYLDDYVRAMGFPNAFQPEL